MRADGATFQCVIFVYANIKKGIMGMRVDGATLQGNQCRASQSHLGRKRHKKHPQEPHSTRCNLPFISEEKPQQEGALVLLMELI
ncbi:hypothetical protein Peur_063363 [Populus x canadensis]